MTATIKLYKKDPCPYCERAIRLLESKQVPFEIIDLTGQPEEIQRLKNETGWMTVPIILINGQLVGGYTDLRDLDNEGKLDALLKESASKN
jgi:glutaredoxin 3